jgi:hypothetical protein
MTNMSGRQPVVYSLNVEHELREVGCYEDAAPRRAE